MRWVDRGILVWRSPFGEGSLTAGFLTLEHGLHAGLLRYGKAVPRGHLQLGNLLDLSWSARLSEHLGSYRGQLMRSYASFILSSGAGRLLALSSACSLLRLCLPERQSMPRLFVHTEALLHELGGLGGLEEEGHDNNDWAEAYCRWELSLLDELGYGLDTSICALGGSVDDLAYISPRSGRAASYQKGQSYSNKLLKLPSFLTSDKRASGTDIEDALRLTGFFLRMRILMPLDKNLPDERLRLWHYFTEPLDAVSESF